MRKTQAVPGRGLDAAGMGCREGHSHVTPRKTWPFIRHQLPRMKAGIGDTAAHRALVAAAMATRLTGLLCGCAGTPSTAGGRGVTHTLCEEGFLVFAIAAVNCSNTCC